MFQYNAQAVLLTNNNLECVDRLRSILSKQNVNLIYNGDFYEFVSNVVNTSPELIIADGSSFRVDKFPYSVLNNFIFREKTKIVILSDTFVCENKYIDVVSFSKIQSYLEEFCKKFNEIQYTAGMDYSNKINNFLLNLGFKPKYIGKIYLADCINVLLNNKFLVNGLTDHSYLMVANKNKTSVANVERDIRTVIKSTFNRIGKTMWREVFNVEFKNTPTNKEFIYLCVEKIKER